LPWTPIDVDIQSKMRVYGNLNNGITVCKLHLILNNVLNRANNKCD